MADVVFQDTPLYSKVRVVLDLTEATSAATAASFPVFNHPLSQISTNNGILKAFSYAVQEPGQLAGFHQSTVLNEAHTNIQRKGQVPGEGAMDIGAIAFVPDGFLLKPATATTLLGCTQVAAGSHFQVSDLALGQIYTQALKLIARGFRPFIQFGDSGAKEYLGSMQLYPSGRGIFDGRIGKLDGPVFKFKSPLRWNPKGKASNLIVGLELKEEQYNCPWAADGGGSATAPGTTIRTALGYAAAGSAPAANGVVTAVCDIMVVLLGERVAYAGD